MGNEPGKGNSPAALCFSGPRLNHWLQVLLAVLPAAWASPAWTPCLAEGFFDAEGEDQAVEAFMASDAPGVWNAEISTVATSTLVEPEAQCRVSGIQSPRIKVQSAKESPEGQAQAVG